MRPEVSDNQPWYKKHSRLLFGLLIPLIAVFIVIYHRSQSPQSLSPEEAALISSSNPGDSSTSSDELNADSVNSDRLRQLIAKSSSSPVDTTALDSQIATIMNNNMDIVFGVSIKDLSTGSVHNYGNQNAMTAASVSKVLTATDYFNEVELGHKSLSAIMVDGNTAQYDIEQMIVLSDNDAWHILNENLGYPQMKEYATSIGINSYDYNYNTLSASDTTKLLGDLYERKLINESNTQLLLSYMERANYRDLIIPAVPTYDTVYHKAGEYLANLNDTAIITNSKDTIVISIYTESLVSYSKSRVAALMQQITTPTLETFKLN